MLTQQVQVVVRTERQEVAAHGCCAVMQILLDAHAVRIEGQTVALFVPQADGSLHPLLILHCPGCGSPLMVETVEVSA